MTIIPQIEAAFGGRLTIERELGGGGMSRVFVAREHHPARQVVVKVLPPELVRETSVERFRREMDVAGAITHPHIVPLLYPSAGTDVLAYAMPFIEGESLRAKLTTSGALPIGEALRIWRELLDALSYAHSRGVVHRDVKPENILLAGRHAMVTDFGVARALSAATGGDRMTSTGLALGTPAYMAPEQAAGDAATDHRADLYAAGLVMWEMLAGRHPFAGMTPSQMMVAHATRTPEPLATARAATPPLLAQLVERCLAKEPADRPQHAEELLAALESLNLSDPTSAGGPVAATQAARVATTKRRGALGWAAVAAVVLAGALGFWRFSAREAQAFDPADVRAIVLIPDRIAPADSLLQRGLMQLLASELEAIPQSAVVVPDGAFLDFAQRVWGLSPATAVNPDTLRLLARRGGTAVMVLLEITRLGSGTNLAAVVETSRDGAPLGRFVEGAETDADLLPAGRRLAAALRRQLGDTLALIEPSEATGVYSTAATAAVDQIRRGFDRFTLGDYLAAADHFHVAVQLDPSFAWGHRQIAVAYNNLGVHRARRIAAMKRARDLAPSARPFERDLIEGLYFSLNEMGDSTYAFYTAMLQRAPQNSTALNNFALEHLRRREFRAAEERARAALAASTLRVPWVAHSNLAVATIAQGNFAVPDSLLRTAPGLAASVRGRQLRQALASSRRDYASTERIILEQAASDTSADQRLDLLQRQTGALALRGKLRAAAAAEREMEALLDSIGAPGDALRAAVRWLQASVGAGTPAPAISRALDSLLAATPLSRLEPLDRPYADLATLATMLGRGTDAARWLAEQERAVASAHPTIDRLELATARALLASLEGRGADALRYATAADSGQCVPCTKPALALAHLTLGDTASAERVWREYLTTPSVFRPAADMLWLPRALRFLGERAEARGDHRSALQHYDELLKLWENADPELQKSLEPIRARVAAIRRRLG